MHLHFGTIEQIESEFNPAEHKNEYYYGVLLGNGNRVMLHEDNLEKIEEENNNMELKENVVNYELKDTVDLMNSIDYKDRFKAEYLQTKIRYDKLHKMIVKYEAGTLGFEPTCNIDLLKGQKSMMGQYLYFLEVRAEVEGVDLQQFK